MTRYPSQGDPADADRASGAPAGVGEAAIGRVFRKEYGRSVASLIRVFGQIDIAEDAVQDAFTLALRIWPRDGLPPSPGGWITTTARRCAIDRLRRAVRGRELLHELAVLEHPRNTETQEVEPVPDDRLRLIFTCCHPALAPEAQVGLTLRLLGGLSTDEVARAFLITEPTMAQRLVRAKRKIKLARIPYRVPNDHELPDPDAGRSGSALPDLQRRLRPRPVAGWRRPSRRGDPTGAAPHLTDAQRTRGDGTTATGASNAIDMRILLLNPVAISDERPSSAAALILGSIAVMMDTAMTPCAIMSSSKTLL